MDLPTEIVTDVIRFIPINQRERPVFAFHHCLREGYHRGIVNKDVFSDPSTYIDIIRKYDGRSDEVEHYTKFACISLSGKEMYDVYRKVVALDNDVASIMAKQVLGHAISDGGADAVHDIIDNNEPLHVLLSLDVFYTSLMNYDVLIPKFRELHEKFDRECCALIATHGWDQLIYNFYNEIYCEEWLPAMTKIMNRMKWDDTFIRDWKDNAARQI